ncbi:MAG TPA: prephenate dehydratase [Steroidobacteraceae bacterium]|nr:prephenate dehydratase [Steroidobacteraceae bacterium]
MPTKPKKKAKVANVAASKDLDVIRKRIDSIDTEIQQLISERARIVHDVGAAKRAASIAQPESPIEYYRPEREAEVLRSVIERNKQNGKPLRDEEMVRLFREIMSACLAQQEPLKVGFLGPEGTFTQQAVLKHFGHSARALPLPTIAEVFYEVQMSHADFGVVPVENSTEGTVNHTLDMFLNSSLKICGEIELRIHQNLMGKMQSLDVIKRVVSHQQSLAQCRGWLDEHLPQAERVPVSSNAEAARRARDEDGTAAIGGTVAADIYSLAIIESNIEDRADNTTRFLVIGRKLFGASGQDKTSLLITGGDTQSPGALYKLLEPFARKGISLSRIESRPSHKKKWDYVFFIDAEGHADEQPLKSVLAEIKKHSSLLRVLGSYPAAVL